MSHRSVEGPMVLCKPSSRRTAGAWPGQGGREAQGPRKTAIFGGGGGVVFQNWGEQERDFKPCVGNFVVSPHVCKQAATRGPKKHHEQQQG